MVTTQECFVPFWINPASNTPQNINCTATCLSSHKISKLNEQDMLDTVDKVGQTHKWYSPVDSYA